MRSATGLRTCICSFSILVFLFTGSVEGVGIRLGLSGGASIPASARWTVDFDDWYWATNLDQGAYRGYGSAANAPLVELAADTMPSSMVFHGRQTGPQFGGELSLEGKQAALGFVLGVYSRRRSTVSLLSPSSGASAVDMGDLDRRLTSFLGFFRHYLFHDADVSPYWGLATGVYHMREQASGMSYSDERTSWGLQGMLGLQARNRTGLFAEVRLELPALDKDRERPWMDFVVVTVAAGVRFGVFR